MKDRLRMFSGNANPKLARDMADYLGVPLGDAHVGRFPDGEIDVKLDTDVRGRDVFIVQPTCHPVNENLMELLILIDCVKRASAERVTAVIPYFGYARKDRKDEGRVPITAKLVANMITTAGADRVLTVDLHATQIQGFFDRPVDHLFGAAIFVDRFRRMGLANVVMVSPDVGSIKMTRSYAKWLDADLAVVDKRRLGPDRAEVVNIIGKVGGKNVIVVDDMITTGGTVAEAARAVKERGAKDIFVWATHPVLAPGAWDRLEASPITRVVVTDTIPVPAVTSNKLEVCTVAPLLGEAVKRIHQGQSVSSLFM